MKIKDLSPNQQLSGIKVRTTDGVEGYWASQWGYEDGEAGVWLRPTKDSSKIEPVFLSKLTEALEWDIIEEENE